MVAKNLALIHLLHIAQTNCNTITWNDFERVTQDFTAQDKLKVIRELLIFCSRRGINFVEEYAAINFVGELETFLDCMEALSYTARSRGDKLSWSKFNTITQRFGLDDAQTPFDAVSFTLLKEQLGEALDTLTEREKKVLRLRFGLKDGEPRTLEEVGKIFNVTRERLRQVEAKALRKLRHPARSKKLKDFLD